MAIADVHVDGIPIHAVAETALHLPLIAPALAVAGVFSVLRAIEVGVTFAIAVDAVDPS